MQMQEQQKMAKKQCQLSRNSNRETEEIKNFIVYLDYSRDDAENIFPEKEPSETQRLNDHQRAQIETNLVEMSRQYFVQNEPDIDSNTEVSMS
jgi:hypothetical protein